MMMISNNKDLAMILGAWSNLMLVIRTFLVINFQESGLVKYDWMIVDAVLYIAFYVASKYQWYDMKLKNDRKHIISFYSFGVYMATILVSVILPD